MDFYSFKRLFGLTSVRYKWVLFYGFVVANKLGHPLVRFWREVRNPYLENELFPELFCHLRFSREEVEHPSHDPGTRGLSGMDTGSLEGG